MTVADTLVVVLGLVLFGLGAAQVITGRNITSRAPSQTSPLHRVGGAMFSFLGLATALNGDRGLLDHTAHGVVALVLAAGALAFAVWALALWLLGTRS